MGPSQMRKSFSIFIKKMEIIKKIFWLCYCMHPVHLKSAGRKCLFLFFVGKARTFSSNLGRNSHYKYQPPSFRISRSKLEQFKRKAFLELHKSFYLLLDFLGYVFMFSNLFLITICN